MLKSCAFINVQVQFPFVTKRHPGICLLSPRFMCQAEMATTGNVSVFAGETNSKLCQDNHMMIESVQRDEVLSCPATIQVFLASKPFAPRSFAGKKQVLKLIEGLKILLSVHA